MDNKTHQGEDGTVDVNVLDGINEMKAMNKEYLDSGKGSNAVREFLLKAADDDELLLRFLKGRKYKPKHAWETIKRNGEVRFDTYPEVFPPTIPNEAMFVLQDNILGVLKGRDREGRRIIYFNGNEWDIEKFGLELLTVVAIHLVERMLLEEDSLNDGVVFVQDCTEVGLRHAKEYTFSNMHRNLNVFWYAFPLKVKGIYYVNVPYVFSLVFDLLRPFLPKKVKERLIVTSPGKKFETLHETLSPDILPKWLGGKLEAEAATDKVFVECLLKRND